MEKFGKLKDGTNVELFTLGADDGLQAEILTLGGTLRRLTLPVNGKRIPLVFALPDLAAYLADTMYIGQIVGRYSNRIAGAQFKLGAKTYKLTANEHDYTLHGGALAFGRYVWEVLSVAEGGNGHVKLGHRSPAGTNGFPGNLDVTATISLRDDTLALHFEAVTDEPTPISLTWHPYFNLSGDPRVPIANHRMQLAASHYLPVKPSWLPTGEIVPVDGTPFDFRAHKELRVPDASTHPQITLARAYNHCWAVDGGAQIAGELWSPESGVRMQIRTDLPGIQVYDGFAISQQYPGWHAVCFEPGNYPDAPNHANFPNSILMPGATHRSFMSFSFSS